MTPPIRVRRRPPVPPADMSWRARLRRKWPWSWWCGIPGCDDRDPWHIPFGVERTQEDALAAGLAHLAEHTETR